MVVAYRSGIRLVGVQAVGEVVAEGLGALAVDPCLEEGPKGRRDFSIGRWRGLFGRPDHLPAGHHPDSEEALLVGLSHVDLYRLVPELVDRGRAPGVFGVGRIQGVRSARCAADVHEFTVVETGHVLTGNVMAIEELLPAEHLLEEPREDLRVAGMVLAHVANVPQGRIDLPRVAGIPGVRELLRLADLVEARLRPHLRRRAHSCAAREIREASV